MHQKPAATNGICVSVDHKKGTQKHVELLQGPASWLGKFYQYRITVFCPDRQRVETLTTTDPYSLSLAADGTHTQASCSTTVKIDISQACFVSEYSSNNGSMSMMSSTVQIRNSEGINHAARRKTSTIVMVSCTSCHDSKHPSFISMHVRWMFI